MSPVRAPSPRIWSWKSFSAVFLAVLILMASIERSCTQSDRVVADEEEDDASLKTEDIKVVSEAAVVPTETSDSESESAEEERKLLVAAPGISTAIVFPKYYVKGGIPSIPAGQNTELVIGLQNAGESDVKVLAIRGTLHFPLDFRYIVQNFTLQEFSGAIVEPGLQASFPYQFTPEKYLQPRDFGLVAEILYEVDGTLFGNVAMNATVEIVEASGSVSGETIFLVLLSIGLLTLLGMWINTQLQKFSKKSKKSKKSDSAQNGDSDVSSNEWLQGTYLTQKQPKNVAQPVKSRKRRT
eukprot:TRINITY_DN7827_c1_g1_i2.p1 TRINITY_DN7827_c1_g1~~TRINITY_DN7827_c1_g1_i2.p1  ORF type:complete len:297 (+),score=66.09 TRINITY_DN7827_c1_g1_i2:137-1027(+)